MFLIRFDLINRDGGLMINFCLMMVVVIPLIIMTIMIDGL